MTKMKLLLILFLIIPVVPVSGCTSIPNYNEDIRILRLVVIHNDYVDVRKALEMLHEASVLTQNEVGIKYVVVKLISLGDDSEYGNLDYKWHDLALRQVRALCYFENIRDKDFDMAIAFNNDTFLLKYLSWLYQKWFGVIDDDYRRFIVLYHPTVRVIRHEIYHGFILSKGHTSKLMGNMAVMSPFGSELNEEDRREVLKNKYRDFSKRVHLSVSNRKDRTSPLAE